VDTSSVSGKSISSAPRKLHYPVTSLDVLSRCKDVEVVIARCVELRRYWKLTNVTSELLLITESSINECLATANLDAALMNFMQDWFPIETRSKSQQNEREAAQEELEELGFDTRGCIVA
jgi:hypothetical protein